ncbi:DUF2339 domain-containing protein [Alkalihalobacillus sp. MEB130]|uniref:DUF2339 domain-containing protein n=1 Tax=Alkalihalobacillus sp. MEB130 TaxID=2976704 RepID=UPI0028DF9A23|nr:DUF2339 domain-containing protein [Alkalihalobacillus sp. MEB130]MDT8862154.1 DUF2339 domain-containing protein [Alkalihalobacillus sp. MEB130]
MTNEQKVQELEERIQKLESEVGRLTELVKETKDSKAKEREKAPIQPRIAPNRPIQHPRPKKDIDYERLIGQVWLPRIFIIVLLLGVLWGFKALIDVGVINEIVRVLLGYVASALLLWFGYHQFRHKRNTLGQVLYGGAIVVLILSTFAGNALYGLIPGFIAFVLNVLWVGAGIYFAHTHKSQSIAVLSSIAGFFVPFLVQGTSTNVYLFVGYEILFFLGLLYFALLKAYVTLYYVSTIFLHVSLLAYLMFTGDGSTFILAGVIIQHIFLLGAFFLRNVFVNKQKAMLVSSFVLTHIWVASTSHFDQAIFLVVAFLMYVGFSYVQRKTDNLHVFMPIATYALAMLLADVFRFEYMSVFLLIQGMVALYVGFFTRAKLQIVFACIVYAFGAMITIFTPISSVASYETIAWIILIGSMIALRELISFFQATFKKSYDYKAMLNFLFGSTALLILAFITQIGNVATADYAQTVQNVTVSVLWASYAIVGVVLGVLKDSKYVRLLGVALLFLTLLKVIFIDIEAISIFVRAILFIGLGAVGVALSRLFYKK